MKILRLFMPIVLTVLSVLPFSACQKFVAIDPPKTQAEITAVFSNEQTATSAVLGLYSTLVGTNLNYMSGALTIYPGLSSDEFVNVTTNSDYDPYKNNALLPNTNTIDSRFWSNAYKYIYQCNAVLEGLENSTTLTKAVKDQLSGEMLIVRALNYFYLVNLFGSVPLVTTTDYLNNSSLPRSASSKVYEQMITDLTTAKKLLANSTISSVNTRPTKACATALLARIYLYAQQWADAEAQATEIITSGTFKLEPNLNNVFITTSAETIFQLMRPSTNTAEGSIFIPLTATLKPSFAITPTLLNNFQSLDSRKSNWLKTSTVSGTTYTYPYKYKIRTGTVVTEDYVVLRLAEQYLIRAEARANQNNLSGAQADLNQIRNRAGLPNTIAVTAPDLLAAVAAERQLELFAEWGHRWLDLKRTNTADAVLSSVKGINWQSTDLLYPVPLGQIQLNPFLTQNQGYN